MGGGMLVTYGVSLFFFFFFSFFLSARGRARQQNVSCQWLKKMTSHQMALAIVILYIPCVTAHDTLSELNRPSLE